MAIQQRSAVLVGNMHSRWTALLFPKVQALLRERGISIVESHSETGHRHLHNRVRGAIESGHRLIVVCGGDGALTAVAGCFAGTKAVLGVIPFGTGNSFAHSLGISTGLAEAADIIAFGYERHVDLGLVNGTYFANFATVGLTSVVADATPRSLKKVMGALAYGVAGIKPLLTHDPFTCTIHWDRNTLKLKTHQVTIVNGRYFGMEPILPRATIADGQLAVFCAASHNRWQLALNFAAILSGQQTKLVDAHYFWATKVKVVTHPRARLAIDGSHLGHTPARFSIAPGALRLMTPRTIPGTVASEPPRL